MLNAATVANGDERGSRVMRCLIVVPLLPARRGAQAGSRTPEDRLAEAVGLARAIDLDIAASLRPPLGSPRPATLLGKGKVEEIGNLVSEHGAGLVVVDHALSPVQQRNLEK